MYWVFESGFADSTGCQVGYVPFDYKKQAWAGPRDWKWQAVAVKPEWLPELVPPGSRLGEITREASESTRVIGIKGDITAQSEDVLMDAYGRASGEGVRSIVLDFTGLDYMNSGGIGLLVTLLVRAQRQGEQVLAFGLSEHYRQIFELTRLDEAVGIHESEDDALAAAGAS